MTTPGIAAALREILDRDMPKPDRALQEKANKLRKQLREGCDLTKEEETFMLGIMNDYPAWLLSVENAEGLERARTA